MIWVCYRHLWGKLTLTNLKKPKVLVAGWQKRELLTWASVTVRNIGPQVREKSTKKSFESEIELLADGLQTPKING